MVKGFGLMTATVLSQSAIMSGFLEVEWGWVMRLVDIEFF